MLRGGIVAAFLLVLLTAGCGAPLPPPVPLQPMARMPGIQGVDLASDSGDVLNQLGSSGLSFVARYYRDPTSRWPALTAAEAQRLSSAGLKIVSVWEFHSGRPEYFSHATGYWDGYNAWREASLAGQPAGSAIYFAVDFNANGPVLYQIDQYFRGVNAAFAALSRGGPGYRIGVYGSGAVCDQITRAHLAQYSWLSNARAWTGYGYYTGWNIRQRGPFAGLSFNHDADEARGDFGAFTLARYAAPDEVLPPQPTPTPMASTAPPQPTPTPTPTPTPVAAVGSVGTSGPVAVVTPISTTVTTAAAAPPPSPSNPPQTESGLGAFMRSLSLF